MLLIDWLKQYAGGASDCYIVVQCSDLTKGNYLNRYGFPVGNKIGGVPQGCYMFLLDANDSNNIKNFTRFFDAFGIGDAIVSCI